MTSLVEPMTLLVLLASTAAVAVLALVTTLSRKGRSDDEARAYLAGFTYVLSNEPDAAIAELSRVAQLSRQTLETYFALGALFRRKGELDRAIRLHQNMLLRSNLLPDVRKRAQLALAGDYKRSALRDLAGQTLDKLLADEPKSVEGLTLYRQVLEESHDWARATELQERLVEATGEGKRILAHLLSERARAEKEPALAERAVVLDDTCADAQLALAQVVGTHNKPKALKALKTALHLEPELAPRNVPLLAKLSESPKDIHKFLSNGGMPFELALALHFRQLGDIERAILQLRRVVERVPRFVEARRELGALLLEFDRSEELRVDYQEILGALGQPATAFVCEACRQKLPEHVFRCPSCEAWDSVVREAVESAPKFDRGSVGT
ncbi:MAG: hypothetical protein ACT4TC_13865 [Myxococcaceae bacterium]